jgi:NADH-quinone oxidoreductase subunit N
MDGLLQAGIWALKPELFLALTTIALLVFGVYRAQRVTLGMVLVALVALAGTAYLVVCAGKAYTGVFLGGMFASNAYTVFAKLLILVSGGLVLLLSSGYLRADGGRPFEFIILTLFALLGMMLMVSAADMLALYMALELSSLALYVLASFHRDEAKSSEAGLKYFVLGALASGMLLFGITLVYGFTGTTSFTELGALFALAPDAAAPASKAVVVGLVLIMIGFCFKLSAVPFHMWTPDVYEGAPTPVAAFFATAPKVAALALFTQLLLGPFQPVVAQWQQVIIAVAVLSMLVGAFAAIVQTNIKRLLAYSSIGHVGFMLMGVAAASAAGVQATLIYLALYVFMSVAMFGCVLRMRVAGQPVEDIKALSGLSQTNPALAIGIAVLMFSMAGIPFLSGFFGKMYVLLAAIDAGLVWLAVVGVLTSVVSCFYYLKVVKIMYFDEPAPALDACASRLLALAIIIGLVVTFLFFVLPMPLVTQAGIAASALVH